jgi:hypothetical protein
MLMGLPTLVHVTKNKTCCIQNSEDPYFWTYLSLSYKEMLSF